VGRLVMPRPAGQAARPRRGCHRLRQHGGAEERCAMGEQSAEPIELPCAEPGCPKQVTYQRQEQPRLAYDHSGSPKSIYLECPRTHIPLRAWRVMGVGEPTRLEDMVVTTAIGCAARAARSSSPSAAATRPPEAGQRGGLAVDGLHWRRSSGALRAQPLSGWAVAMLVAPALLLVAAYAVAIWAGAASGVGVRPAGGAGDQGGALARQSREALAVASSVLPAGLGGAGGDGGDC
jgi:hypothetical protein